MGKKMKFEVQENETIDQCLDRIKSEGYTPVKRLEKPIFKENVVNGQKSYEPVASQIVFEAVKLEL
ncbi:MULTISPECIES: NETI motif-containing protein [unclassified Niallia]|uniref:NETI motif-containing protein n=1 Tax=unclassified Niallia TaxID=2837522 RepID=UPI001EDA9DBF|nr:MULTISPECIES: NETI motif-containing protein [unclassified Niallia]MDL0436936.1 NETI motif-containing protein [Niallia sp. SS-2023]UPO87995.1 NETI motif-containing protein [Niallia sp. Man26]